MARFQRFVWSPVIHSFHHPVFSHHSLLINLNYHVYILFSTLHSLRSFVIHSLVIHSHSSNLRHPVSTAHPISLSSNLRHPISIIHSQTSSIYCQISIIQSPSSNLHHSCFIIPLNHPHFHTLPTWPPSVLFDYGMLLTGTSS